MVQTQINEQDYPNFRQEKFFLARNLCTHFKDSFEEIFKASFCKVNLQFHYLGPSTIEAIDFLNQYLNSFKVFDFENKFSDVKIFYKEGTDFWGKANIPHWNYWEDQIIFEENVEWDVVIERDFVAKVSKDGSIIFAQGPKLSFQTCDSLDNLLVYSLGRFLIKKNALILHAATVVDKDNAAFVFFGPSGAGKSTIATHLNNTYGLKVISSDQVFLRMENNKLWVEAVPTTIPEFPLDHPAREKKPVIVKNMFYLKKSEEKDLDLVEMNQVDFIQRILQESMFRSEFGSADELLKLVCHIVFSQNKYYQISYRKDFHFLNQLKELL